MNGAGYLFKPTLVHNDTRSRLCKPTLYSDTGETCVPHPNLNIVKSGLPAPRFLNKFGFIKNSVIDYIFSYVAQYDVFNIIFL